MLRSTFQSYRHCSNVNASSLDKKIVKLLIETLCLLLGYHLYSPFNMGRNMEKEEGNKANPLSSTYLYCSSEPKLVNLLGRHE